jgi:TolB-like protein
MPSLLPSYEYDIFISYRHNDNRSGASAGSGQGWVTEFVNALQEELAATIKEPLNIYFDKNPHDGLLETHSVDKSLEGKLKCLIFIPIISQTYCDPKSFAWQHEFCAFNRLAKEDQFGRDIKLSNGNVASRILPVKIHDLDADDKTLLEKELGGVLRAVEFIYKEPGVNRPLKSNDNKADNLNKTDYRNQVNKVANAIKETISALRNPASTSASSTQNIAPSTQPGSSRWKVIGALLFLALAATVGYYFYGQRATINQPILDKSIAVLPFVNMSNDPEQEYFSDGLTEEIIDRLTKIPDLRVISRTSVMEYKKSDKRIPEIAKELGVAFILEGSVRRSGDNLRITVQLIKAGNDEHIWSETLDKPMSEIFQMQRDIATQLASYFKITLTQSESGRLDEIPTKFISAYDYYLQARELSSKRSAENDKAIKLLKQALSVDPHFMEAMAILSNRYTQTGNQLHEKENWQDSALNYARKALALAPESPRANHAMGFVLWGPPENLSSAKFYFRKANGLSPNSSYGLRPLSNIYLGEGLIDSSYFFAKRLCQVDPIPSSYSILSSIFSSIGQWDSARYYVNLALTAKMGSTTNSDLAIHDALRFFIAVRDLDGGLRLINESFGSVKGAMPDGVQRDMKWILALKEDWGSLSAVLSDNDMELKALMLRNTNKKKEFDSLVESLKKENREGHNHNFLLLIGDYQMVVSSLKALPPQKRYVSRIFFLSNPFAQEFVKTQEFKELFVGYEAWAEKMMTDMKLMNERSL